MLQEVLQFASQHQNELWLLGTVVAGVITGSKSYKALLIAAAKVVAEVAEMALDSQAKRAMAVDMLYKALPAPLKVVPKFLLVSVVETAWNSVVKPLIVKAEAAKV